MMDDMISYVDDEARYYHTPRPWRIWSVIIFRFNMSRPVKLLLLQHQQLTEKSNNCIRNSVKEWMLVDERERFVSELCVFILLQPFE